MADDSEEYVAPDMMPDIPSASADLVTMPTDSFEIVKERFDLPTDSFESIQASGQGGNVYQPFAPPPISTPIDEPQQNQSESE